MNFSYEELYHMYGQYDSLVTINFRYNSDSYKIFGQSLMGTIIYTEEERNELEKVLKFQPVARTERIIRIMPSPVIKLSPKQYEQAERYGFLCSDIFEILVYNKPRQNNFIATEKKEFQNTTTININSNRKQLNQLAYGFLNSRFKSGEPLSPEEKCKFLGLAKYFGVDITIEPYLNLNQNVEAIRYHELNAKFIDLIINTEEINEFAGLNILRFNEKEKLINAEIKRSGEKLKAIAEKFNDEIENLKRAAHGFDEEIILFGEKLIYLEIERFIHIYARHVTETKIGGEFEGKTIFQYKFDDIIKLIKVVIESEADAIQEHFKNNPDKTFFRIVKRSTYFNGHYYRIGIEPNGRLLTFHPYNNNEEKQPNADDENDLQIEIA